MKLGFELVCLDEGGAGTLYSVRFDGEELTEFEKFIENPTVKAADEYDELLARLDDMVDMLGFK